MHNPKPTGSGHILGQEVGVVVVVGELVQEGARLQDEGGKDHLGQVHARPDLLQQGPDQGLVLLRDCLRLRRLARLQHQNTPETPSWWT